MKNEGGGINEPEIEEKALKRRIRDIGRMKEGRNARNDSEYTPMREVMHQTDEKSSTKEREVT